jgi:cyclic dehypoxanthinyl futalosine synthase
MSNIGRMLEYVNKRSDVIDILERVLNDANSNEYNLHLEDCVRLLESDDIHSIGFVGNAIRERLFNNISTFVNNINLNYTNVCVTYCKFCAFYRPPGHDEGYVRSKEEIVNRVSACKQRYNITQLLIQGGHNPDLKLSYYEEIFREIKHKCPGIAIHGLTPSEIDTISKVERSSTKEVLSRLKLAGLDSFPGGGAEILDDDVKSIISPLKIKSDAWLRIMEEAHRIGLKSSATMMYGTVENNEQIARHIMKIVDLQQKTRGFMAFIPWNFEPNNTAIQAEGQIKYSSGGWKLLKMIAISRIMFYNSIPHIQSSWLTNGTGLAQLALCYGADDFGGTLIDEEVVSATGARSTEISASKIIDTVRQIGYIPAERDNFYKIIHEYH